ncbi:MAG: amidohydrolase family protein [Planctomycetota bacterium]|jgi:predicted TIM-barrel fold metal-dependent hydrolase
MIVDCHTHIDSTGEEIEASEHLSASETVDVCIVLAKTRRGESNTEINRKLSAYINKHSEKTVGFALVDPRRDKINVKNVASNKEKLGLSGAVLYCSEMGFHPVHSRAMRFYESAEEVGLPVFFHNGEPLGTDAVLDYAQPYLLDEVARTFKTLKIVVGNMGFPFVEQTLSVLAKNENVYADLTISPSRIWQVYNTVVSAYERGVMEKLLFGSGYPDGRAGECIETLLGFNKLLPEASLPPVPRDNIRNIIERNSLELLGIEH